MDRPRQLFGLRATYGRTPTVTVGAPVQVDIGLSPRGEGRLGDPTDRWPA